MLECRVVPFQNEGNRVICMLHCNIIIRYLLKPVWMGPGRYVPRVESAVDLNHSGNIPVEGGHSSERQDSGVVGLCEWG